jgi:hypothetical protein
LPLPLDRLTPCVVSENPPRNSEWKKPGTSDVG